MTLEQLAKKIIEEKLSQSKTYNLLTNHFSFSEIKFTPKAIITKTSEKTNYCFFYKRNCQFNGYWTIYS